MFKSIALSCLLLFLLVNVKAQKHKNEISINGQSSVPGNSMRPGVGGFVEGLYGTGKTAQLSFNAGVFVFRGQPRYKPGVVATVIPFQIGFKQNFKKFYLQPQAGYGPLIGKIKETAYVPRPSVGALFYGLNLGFGFKKINVGLSLQQVELIRSGDPQIWNTKQFEYTGIFVGYIF